MSTRFSTRGLVVIGTLAFIALFGVALRSVSLAAILAGVQRVGGGFLWIVLLAGVRLAARAGAWSACAGGTARLPFRAAFTANIVGEAAGTLTPLGPAASEPAKVLWVRQYIGTMESAASLAAETVLYVLGATAMLVTGGVVSVMLFVHSPTKRACFIALIVLPCVVAIVASTRRGRCGRSSGMLARLDARVRSRPHVRALAEGLRRIAETLRDLKSHEPATLAAAFLMQVGFQAAAVGEVWVMLVLLGLSDATLLQAFLLEFANRGVTVVFKFVPMRLGVDEVASGAMASLLGQGATLGVTLAVIRKARMLAWSAVGLGLAAHRAFPFGARPERIVLAEPVDHRTT